MMSGSPFSPFVGLDKHPRHYADRMIESLGGDPRQPLEDIISFLQSKPAVEMQSLTNMFEEFIRSESFSLDGEFGLDMRGNILYPVRIFSSQHE